MNGPGGQCARHRIDRDLWEWHRPKRRRRGNEVKWTVRPVNVSAIESAGTYGNGTAPDGVN